jgi:hypothetical protein
MYAKILSGSVRDLANAMETRAMEAAQPTRPLPPKKPAPSPHPPPTTETRGYNGSVSNTQPNSANTVSPRPNRPLPTPTGPPNKPVPRPATKTLNASQNG